jgi:hypothetical protein
MYAIGNKVQARDGRIGTVIDTEAIANLGLVHYAKVVVQFLDGNEVEGAAEHFKAIKERFSCTVDRH